LFKSTVTPQGEKTTLFVIWKDFEKAEFLDDVEILIETTQTNQQAGTTLRITGDRSDLSEWSEKQFKKLSFELKKLVPPVLPMMNPGKRSGFQISLQIKNLPDVADSNDMIEPYPIIDLYDYRISGEINEDGNGILIYSNQKIRNSIDQTIEFHGSGPTQCGVLHFDIRVYDREKESIESLIKRGLKDEHGDYVGKLQARQLLNENNGIEVYRHGFRIRPLGDADFDWLRLNEQRIQNFALRIGSNQVIGFVQIESEEQSNLTEKSARDGLRDNSAYASLKKIAKEVINELEQRRLQYRMKAGLSRPTLKLERELESLFSLNELKKGIRKKLLESGFDSKATDEIIEIINRDESKKSKMADDIRKAVAVYQGQATLGKIINVILHEGRRPLNYFKNQVPNVKYWHESILKKPNPEKREKLLSVIFGIGDNADIFAKLFSRLDPLAAAKRSSRKPIVLLETIKATFGVFEGEIHDKDVNIVFSGQDSFKYSCWSQDIYAIFTNLIDNSLYWMVEKKTPGKEINIRIETKDNILLYIDYRDSGPGIEPSLIASEVIFEPQFSTKIDGTGLGLAIAGEAATRNGLELKAFETESGAYFRLEPIQEID